MIEGGQMKQAGPLRDLGELDYAQVRLDVLRKERQKREILAAHTVKPLQKSADEIPMPTQAIEDARTSSARQDAAIANLSVHQAMSNCSFPREEGKHRGPKRITGGRAFELNKPTEEEKAGRVDRYDDDSLNNQSLMSNNPFEAIQQEERELRA